MAANSLTSLNNVMIGEREIETLSAEVIATIASYTESNAGALYILEGKELKRRWRLCILYRAFARFDQDQ